MICSRPQWTYSAFVLTVVFFICGVATAQPGSNEKYVPGQLLVRFRPGTRVPAVQAAHRALAADVVQTFSGVEGLQLVRIPKAANLSQSIAAYRANPDVLYAEPNYIVHALQTPNDPLFPGMWSLLNTGQAGGTPGADIKATQAWNITTGSANVVIAVIDTGVDYNHPDLAANIFTGPICSGGVVCHGFNRDSGNSNTDPNDPLDDNGHGTHVSGTIGAVGNNALGVTGINWNVTILPCKFLNSQGAGAISDAITCLDLIKGLRDGGMNIVASNNSWGGGDFSQALQDAIDRQRQSGILFIAAAGNDFNDADLFPAYPASYPLPNVISVAATNRNDQRAVFSNFGQHSVHLGAPGQDILSTFLGGTYATESGTSMAAPHVTGVAALLAAQAPARDWRAIKNLLLTGGDSVPAMAKTISGKRLNAFASLSCTNSPLTARLSPISDIASGSAGVPVALSAININCAQPAGPVQVTVTPGGQTITLADDGLAPDLAAGDGIYAGSFVPPAPGVYTLTFSTGGAVTLQVLNIYQAAITTSTYRAITGTSLDLNDDGVAQIASPFPILFGNGSFTQLWASANGTISLSGAFSAYANEFMPTNSPALGAPPLAPASTLIAPFWDDLFPVKGTAQNVFWAVTGVAPNRELVVEWRDVKAFECSNEPDTVKFQVVFFENSSNVLFNYSDVLFGGTCLFHDRGASATVGIQVSPQLGTMWSFAGQSVSNGMGILWSVSDVPPATGTPQVTAVSPNLIQDLSPDTTITVTGSGFVPQSKVMIQGAQHLTTFVSSTQLTALIPAAELDLFALSSTTRSVRVENPGPIDSLNPVTLTISPLPNPTITALSPASATAGGFSFQLKITGANFEFFSTAKWNGQPLQSFASSRSELTALVFAPLIGSPGTALVQVETAGVGGGISAAVPFTISAPAGPAPLTSQSFAVMHAGRSTTAIGLTPPALPSRFLGWNYSRKQGPEYLKQFVRPYASQFTTAAFDVSKILPQNLNPSTAAVVPPPLPGLNLRDSLLAGFLPSGIAAGDFNRDGHMDWVVSNAGSNDLWVYFGNGDGTAQPPRIIRLAGQTPLAVAAVDLRGTGILDLVVVEPDSLTVGVLLGNGDGTFAPETTYFTQAPAVSLAIADFNGDGHPDVVVGLVDNVNALAFLAGDGTGKLKDAVPTPITDFAVLFNAVAVADFNKDGIPDLIVTDLGINAGVDIYLGVGDGTFKKFRQVLESVPPGDVFLNAVAGDLNGDGCPDFVAATQFGATLTELGNCDGTFSFNPLLRFGEGEVGIGMLLVDINGDGKLDLITSGVNVREGGPSVGAESGSLVSVQFGDGAGGFELAHVYRGKSGMFGLAVADLNGDGHPDIIAPSQDTDTVTVFMNNGSAGFGDPQGVYTGWNQKGNTVPGGIINPNDAVFAFDVNGDGFKDLVYLDFGQLFPLPHALAVKLNDGTGHFLPETRVAVMDGSFDYGDLAHGDFRHTGREDIILVPSLFTLESSANQYIFIPNTGAGNFGPPVVTSITHAPGALAVGDFNGDGNLDFVMVGFSGGVPLLLSTFLGNGDGTFRPGPTQTFDASFPPGAIFVGDVNGDGKLDILVPVNTGAGGTLLEFLSNGDGSFAPPRPVITGFSAGTSIFNTFFAVADLNGDGRTDVVKRNASSFSGVPSFSIYLAQPDGSMSLTQTYSPYTGVNFVPFRAPLQFVSDFMGDFNGDGKQDLAAFQSSPNGQFVQFLLGNGDGTFTPSFTPFPLGNSLAAPSLIADLNNDGRADLFELDGLAASYQVMTSTAGSSLRLQFDSLPVIGPNSAVRVSLAFPALQDTPVQLTSSDPGIAVPASTTIPAGSLFRDINFQVTPAFDTTHTFSITAQTATESAKALASVAVPGSNIGVVLSSAISLQAVLAGNTTLDYSFLVSSRGGYSTSMNLSCTGLPAGATCQFGTNPLIVAAGGTSVSPLTVATTSAVPIGNYNFSVVAADASITQSLPAAVHVGDFTMDLQPGTIVTALPTGFANFVLTMGSVNQFGGTVSLSMTGLPPGATSQLNSVTSAGNVERFLIQTLNVPSGDYPLLITGTSGNVTKTATGVLRVGDFGAATINPTTATLSVGQSANFALSLNSINGFVGQVGFICNPTVNGKPVSGVQCLFNPQPATFDPSGKTSTQLTVSIVNRPNSTVVPRVIGRTSWPSPSRFIVLGLALLLPFVVLITGKRRKQVLLMCLAFLGLALAVSCGGGGSSGSNPPPPPPPPPQNVIITVTAQGQGFSKIVGSLSVTVQ